MAPDKLSIFKKEDLSISVPSLSYAIQTKHFYNEFLLKSKNNFQKLAC